MLHNWLIFNFGDSVAVVALPQGGALPAGIYKLCFTAKSSTGVLSGSSSVATIELQANQSIRISNVTTEDVWCTEVNGSEFFYVGNVSLITSIESIEPLPTYLVTEPKKMTCLAFWNGRIWGAVGNDIVYSEAFGYEWFREENFIPLDGEVVMVADAPDGIYAATKSKTFFINSKFEISTIDTVGVVPGTLTKSSFTKLGEDIPTWITEKGVAAGVSGKVVYLTTAVVKFDVGSKGASIFSRRSGVAKLLATLEQPSYATAGIGDDVTAEVVRNGVVISGVEFVRTQQDDVILSDAVSLS